MKISDILKEAYPSSEEDPYTHLIQQSLENDFGVLTQDLDDETFEELSQHPLISQAAEDSYDYADDTGPTIDISVDVVSAALEDMGNKRMAMNDPHDEGDYRYQERKDRELDR